MFGFQVECSTFTVASTGGGGGGGSSPSYPPSGSFSVLINDGASETITTTISLRFQGGIDTRWIDVGESSSFTPGSYKTFTYLGSEHSYPYTLSTHYSLPTTATVYARFWNSSYAYPSLTVSDSILLKLPESILVLPLAATSTPSAPSVPSPSLEPPTFNF